MHYTGEQLCFVDKIYPMINTIKFHVFMRVVQTIRHILAASPFLFAPRESCKLYVQKRGLRV